MKIKRLFSVVMSMVLILSMANFTNSTISVAATHYSTVYYTSSAWDYYTGTETNLIFPDYVSYYKMTTINESAFAGNTLINSVILPDTVTSIESSAFRGCSNLSEIVIPSSVNTIASDAFEGCNQLKIYVCINSYAQYFAYDNGYTFVVVPSEIYTFGDYTYKLFTDKKAEITKYNGTSDTPVIPSTIDGYEIVSIGKGAFKNSSLISVDIPDTVISIRDEAFMNCSNLTSIKFPRSVKNIGLSAFESCSSLREIIAFEITTLGQEAFYKCSDEMILSALEGSALDIYAQFNEYNFIKLDNVYDISEYVEIFVTSEFKGSESIFSLTNSKTGEVLVKGTDYTQTYTNSDFIFTGLGNYFNNVTISALDIFSDIKEFGSNISVQLSNEYFWTLKMIPEVYVVDTARNYKVLTENVDYTLTISENEDVITISPIGNYLGKSKTISSKLVVFEEEIIQAKQPSYGNFIIPVGQEITSSTPSN
ncbi:MAG: leucine-rich repeat domain-containing protein, partial [Oscillospiraceae bacterium]|nr:leucine-rich repeat domain-containing protein [Oscillospiraceae bacterium]